MTKPSRHPEKIEQALKVLLKRIRGGQEFPDAVWAVSRSQGVDYQALSAAYDEHHGG